MKDAVGTALVTGGAKRIGRAIVEDLASHGFSVAIHANKSVAEAERLAAQIVARGGRAEPIIAPRIAGGLSIEPIVFTTPSTAATMPRAGSASARP